MKPKILIVYPNLPLMMSPAISVAIINAICKREKCDVKLKRLHLFGGIFHHI